MAGRPRLWRLGGLTHILQVGSVRAGTGLQGCQPQSNLSAMVPGLPESFIPLLFHSLIHQHDCSSRAQQQAWHMGVGAPDVLNENTTQQIQRPAGTSSCARSGNGTRHCLCSWGIPIKLQWANCRLSRPHQSWRTRVVFLVEGSPESRGWPA